MRLCNMRSSIRIMLGDTFFSFLFVISPFFVFSFSYNVAKWTQFRKAKDRKKDFSQKLERYRLRGARKNEVAGKWMNRFMEPVCIYIVVSNVHQHFNNKHISVALEKKYRILFFFVLVFAYMPKLKTKRGIFSECDSHEFNWNINPSPKWRQKNSIGIGRRTR